MKYTNIIDVFLYKKHVGTLGIVKKDIFFEYDSDFVKNGFSISPIALPLKSGIIRNKEKEFEGLFGVFNDSLPDGWGRLLIDKSLVKQSILLHNVSPLDRLSIVGKNGMGALEYVPENKDLWIDDVELDIDSINDKAQKILLEEEKEDELKELRSLNGSSCGARPKITALYNMKTNKFYQDKGEPISDKNVEHWIVKFNSSSDSKYATNIEYAYSLMAQACGIEMSQTRLFSSKKNTYFGTKRFDRNGNKKIHMHTLSGILNSDHKNVELDYEHLIQVVQKFTRSNEEVEKAFRLACFNVLAHNRDDHGKNFALCLNEEGYWYLSPAYDLTFSDGPRYWQSTSVLGEGQNPTAKNLLALGKKYNIKKATQIIDEVLYYVRSWDIYAQEAKISEKISYEIEKVLKKECSLNL